MTRVSVRAAVVLASVLLLAGCAGTPATAHRSGLPPSPAASGTGFEFVTLVADDPPKAVDGWTTRDPVVEWAEQYCEREGLTPCTDVAGRAVDMCIERRDCHPALLVPFDQGTAAFVSGGNFVHPMIIAVWRAESDPALAQYGGARELLESYLVTVEVFPTFTR